MTLMSYLGKGGPIMYVLLMLNIFGVSIMIWKALAILKLNRERPIIIGGFQTRLEKMRPHAENLTAFRQMVKDEVSYFFSQVEKGLDKIKLIAVISPLLGLLGTVIGILASFEAISQIGFGDPSRFADGISIALITTVGGLIVSIPHYIGYHFLIRSLDASEALTEKELLDATWAAGTSSSMHASGKVV